MRLVLIFLFSTLCCKPSCAQSPRDTNKYYIDWIKKKCTPEKGEYYRISYKEGEYWRVKDFYLSTGTLEANGLYFEDSFITPQGMHYWYLASGKLRRKGRYIDGLKEGIWKEYDGEGKLLDSSLFKKDMPWKFAYRWFDGKLMFRGIYDDSAKGTGYETIYYDNGTISEFGKYAEGYKKDSVWTYYYRNGQLSCKERYDKGSVINIECFNEAGVAEKCEIDSSLIKKGIPKELAYHANNCYRLVGKMPKAPYDVNRFLGTNIRYPASARESNIEGRVAVQFFVDEDGNLVNIKTIHTSDRMEDLENEALRVVSQMPKWEPGRDHNRPVRVYYTLPVVFRLE